MKIWGGGANLIYIWIGTSRWVFFSTSPFIKIITPDFWEAERQSSGK